MYTPEDFSQAFADYIEYNRKLIESITPTQGVAGVLGFGMKPGDDPGHSEFFGQMEKAIKKAAEQNPDSDTAASIINVIFDARNIYKNEEVSEFVFSACEGMTIDLVPFLTKDKASEIYNNYKKLIPWRKRIPLQKKLLKALKEKAE